MKKSTLLSSTESTIINEDRIINRDNLNPYKYEKRLLNLYDYETNKNKYNLNSIQSEKSLKNNGDSIKNKTKNEPANLLNFRQKENSALQGFNRNKELEKENIKHNNNSISENNNDIPINSIINTKKFEENKSQSLKNDFNYNKHLKVFNSLSNFSESDEKLLKNNESLLTHDSRHDNKNNNNISNHQYNDLQYYDENLNRYRRKYITTTDSKDSFDNHRSLEKKNQITNSSNKNKNYHDNNNYIKINDSTEIMQNNISKEKKAIQIKTDNNKSNMISNPSSNLMGIQTSKLHKTIEKDLKDYDNMSKILRDQIGEYNSKLNQISKGNSNNIQKQLPKTFLEDTKNVYNNLDNEINKNNIGKLYMNNVDKTDINNNFDSNYISNLRNDLKENVKEKQNFKYLNNLAMRGAYEHLGNDKVSVNNQINNIYHNNMKKLNYDYNKISINTLDNQSMNYYTIDNNSLSMNNNNSNTYANKNNYNKYSDINLNNYEQIAKIEDLEKNIFYLKNRIETNLKNRDVMMEKFKEEKSSILDSDRKLYNQRSEFKDRLNKIEKETNLELNSFSNSINTNLINFEKDRNNTSNITQKMDILINSTEENNHKNNIINDYLKKYEENIQQEKDKNDGLQKIKIQDDMKKYNFNYDYKSQMVDKLPSYDNSKDNVMLPNSNTLINTSKYNLNNKHETLNSKSKIMELIKDCKEEIEFYKKKISKENTEYGLIDPILNENIINAKYNFNSENNSHHKNNFTLGRAQDFNNVKKESDENINNNSTVNRRINSISAERYQDDNKLIKNDVSSLTNETCSTIRGNKNTNKNNKNDYITNNLTIDTISSKSKIRNKKFKACDNTYSNNITITNTSNLNTLNDSKIRSKSNSKVNKDNNKNTNLKLRENSRIKNSNRISENKILNNNLNNVERIFPLKNYTKLNSNNYKSENKSIRTIVTVTNSKNSTPLKNKKIQNNYATHSKEKDRKTSIVCRKLLELEKRQDVSEFSKREKINKKNNSSSKYLNTNNTINTYSSRSVHNTLNTVSTNRKVYNKGNSYNNINHDDISKDENFENLQIQKRQILLGENKIMCEKIRQLEAKLDFIIKTNAQILNEQHYNNIDKSNFTNNNDINNMNNENITLTKNHQNNLLLELQIWKGRSEKMTENYIQTLGELKNKLKSDKKLFIDQVKNMQDEFQAEVERIKKVYEANILRNEKTIKKLKTQNEEITKKFSRVKDIVAHNNQNNSKFYHQISTDLNGKK